VSQTQTLQKSLVDKDMQKNVLKLLMLGMQSVENTLVMLSYNAFEVILDKVNQFLIEDFL